MPGCYFEDAVDAAATAASGGLDTDESACHERSGHGYSTAETGTTIELCNLSGSPPDEHCQLRHAQLSRRVILFIGAAAVTRSTLHANPQPAASAATVRTGAATAV